MPVVPVAFDNSPSMLDRAETGMPFEELAGMALLIAILVQLVHAHRRVRDTGTSPRRRYRIEILAGSYSGLLLSRARYVRNVPPTSNLAVGLARATAAAPMEAPPPPRFRPLHAKRTSIVRQSRPTASNRRPAETNHNRTGSIDRLAHAQAEAAHARGTPRPLGECASWQFH